jgi:hypothetical protein
LQSGSQGIPIPGKNQLNSGGGLLASFSSGLHKIAKLDPTPAIAYVDSAKLLAFTLGLSYNQDSHKFQIKQDQKFAVAQTLSPLYLDLHNPL